MKLKTLSIVPDRRSRSLLVAGTTAGRPGCRAPPSPVRSCGDDQPRVAGQCRRGRFVRHSFEVGRHRRPQLDHHRRCGHEPHHRCRHHRSDVRLCLTDSSTRRNAAGPLALPGDAAPPLGRTCAASPTWETAYNDAAGRSHGHSLRRRLGRREIGVFEFPWLAGLSLRGVPASPSRRTPPLAGGANHVWIFADRRFPQLEASATKVILSGGAQAKNVFWQTAAAWLASERPPTLRNHPRQEP